MTACVAQLTSWLSLSFSTGGAIKVQEGGADCAKLGDDADDIKSCACCVCPYTARRADGHGAIGMGDVGGMFFEVALFLVVDSRETYPRRRASRDECKLVSFACSHSAGDSGGARTTPGTATGPVRNDADEADDTL